MTEAGELQSMVWDGVTDSAVLSDTAARARHDVADAARDYQWSRLLELIARDHALVNSTRLGGASRFAPLHQVALGGAPVEVAARLIELGAWRTLQNSRGERPVDVAVRSRQRHLLNALEPVYLRHVPLGILLTIQRHLHAVILERIARLDGALTLRLPELEPLLECREGKVWFPVPGMYGGFSYWLAEDGVEATLVAESWCRVVDGSGQRHEITSAGARLVAEGFV